MSELEGYRITPDTDRKKAQVFFKQGRTVAQSGQFDYAIEMFTQGLALDPEDVSAHQELRDISLKRKASGGKDMGMFARMKLRYGKDDKDNMVLAEKFLAFDPGNTGRMLEMLNYALAAGCYDTLKWIGPILQRANTESGKPELSKYVALKDAYYKLKLYREATDAAMLALQMRPEDMNLQQDVKNLAAMQTMNEGGYQQGGGFRASMKDTEGQDRLMNADKDIRTVDMMAMQLREARAEYQREPNEPGKISRLVDVLVKSELSDNENEAIEILDAAFKKSGQFRYRLRVGQVKMAQLRRMERPLREAAVANPNDQEATKMHDEFVRDRLAEELKEYTLAAENYPTDLGYKYEMARRLVILQRYSEAIPLLQHARQDPKLRVDVTIELGKAFLAAEFLDEAIDTLKEMTETYQVAGDTKAKEIFYWYGRSLEARADIADAIKCFSRVTMWDFNYRDVQTRIKRLRAGV